MVAISPCFEILFCFWRPRDLILCVKRISIRISQETTFQILSNLSVPGSGKLKKIAKQKIICSRKGGKKPEGFCDRDVPNYFHSTIMDTICHLSFLLYIVDFLLKPLFFSNILRLFHPTTLISSAYLLLPTLRLSRPPSYVWISFFFWSSSQSFQKPR